MKFWRKWEWQLIASPVSQEVPLIKMVSSSRESWKSPGLDNDAIWGKREKKHESRGPEQDMKWYKQTQTSGWWLVSVAEWWSDPDAANYYHSLHWAQASEQRAVSKTVTVSWSLGIWVSGLQTLGRNLGQACAIMIWYYNGYSSWFYLKGSDGAQSVWNTHSVTVAVLITEY